MEIRKTIPLPQARDPQQVREEQLGKLKEASRLYEKQFIGEMVKAMRSTVQKSDLIPETFGERLFRDKLDQEYIESWSQRGGVGLGDMIYTQLKERYFPEKLNRLGPIQGPLPVDQGEGALKMKGVGGQGKGPIEIEMHPTTDTVPEQSLRAPWAGRLLLAEANEDGTKTLMLDHGEGIRSEIKHTGSLKSLKTGQEISAGEILGEVRGNGAFVKWNLWT